MENETKNITANIDANIDGNNAEKPLANLEELLDDDTLIEIERNFAEHQPPELIIADDKPPQTTDSTNETPQFVAAPIPTPETVENEIKAPLENQRTHADSSEILHFLTTEHAALQTTRAAHVADANGRAQIFVTAVFGGIIALGFAGNAGAAFFEFALILLPSLFFLGWATFVRLLQIALEDVLHSRGTNRIRHYYSEIAPETLDYFVNSIHDDRFAALEGMFVRRSFVQSLATTAGTVLILNAMLLGASIAFGAVYFLAAPNWFALVIAAGVFFVALAAGGFYQNRVWEDFEANLTAKFPAKM